MYHVSTHVKVLKFIISLKTFLQMFYFSGIMLKSEELSGSKSLSLQVSMSGGKGNLAWQHTQLFRTKMDDNETTQFRLIIQLKEVSS